MMPTDHPPASPDPRRPPTSNDVELILGRLYDAMERDDVEALQRVAAESPRYATAPAFFCTCVTHGSARFVAALLDLGASPASEDEAGWSALGLAAQSTVEKIRLLVEAGADPDFLPEDRDPGLDPERRGESALFWALRHGDPQIIAYLESVTSPRVSQLARDAQNRWRAWEENKDSGVPF